MVNKHPVGAHYGWKDWLIQRITAAIMAVMSLFIFGYLLVKGGVSYGEWKQLFSGQPMRVAAMLFLLSVFYHAWIGIRDVLMDYIKPMWLRLGLQVGVMLFLLGSTIWSAAILWGY